MTTCGIDFARFTVKYLCQIRQSWIDWRNGCIACVISVDVCMEVKHANVMSSAEMSKTPTSALYQFLLRLLRSGFGASCLGALSWKYSPRRMSPTTNVCLLTSWHFYWDKRYFWRHYLCLTVQSPTNGIGAGPLPLRDLKGLDSESPLNPTLTRGELWVPLR